MIRQKQQTKGQTLPTMLVKSMAVLAFLFLLPLLQPSTLFAQQWEKFITIPDSMTNYVNSILETPEGDIVIAAHVGNGSNTDQIYISKLDNFGNLIWENNFGTDSYDEVRSMALTPDGGLIMGGFTYAVAGAGNGQCYLVKVDSDGQLEWEQEYGGSDTGPEIFDRIHGVTTTTDGGYVFCGWISSEMGNDVSEASLGGEDGWIVKVAADGNVQWDRRVGGSERDRLYDITNTPDGGFVIVGTQYNPLPGLNISDVWAIKLNATGVTQWENTYGGTVEDQGFSVEPTDDNGFIISGATFNPQNGDSDMYLLKIEANGTEEWSTPIGGTLGEWGSYAVQTETGGYAIAGSTRSHGSDSLDVFLVFTDSNGDSLSQKVYEGGSNEDNVNYMSKAADGGFLIAAQDRSLDSFPDATSKMYLLKTGPDGETLTTNVQGSVYWDTNGDCIEDVAEEGLNDWLVVLASEDRTFYATTDVNGDYSVLLDTGDYEVSVILPNHYWTGSCGIQQNLNVTSYYDTLSNIDFSAATETNCYYLEGDISTPFLTPCEDAVYTVRYCNTGTVSAFGTFSEIELDEHFTLNSVSQPYTLTGNQLTVGIGTIAPGACDSFQISVNLDCTAVIPRQTHGLALNLVPNLLCTPPSPGWDNSSLSVEAECDMDSVRIILTNDGSGGMSEPQPYIIIIDDLVARADVVQIGSGGSVAITEPAEGATIRIVAEQSDNHPGRSAPTVAVEGCGTNTAGGISLGYVTQFGEDDADSHRSEDMQESIDSMMPAMLRAFPKGHHIENYIKPNQDIEYHIRCQNTSGDTVNQIIIENIIPAELDVTTIQPGSASHDYDFEIVGEGLLRFRFDNLQLMDSTSNVDQSQLFVKFRISQKENLEAETEIANQISILCGDTIVQSNTVFHTVEKEVIYEPVLYELCIGTLFDDRFIVENDTVLLDTVSFSTYDQWEITNIDALENTYTTIDTIILAGTPYQGIVYEQDTTFTISYGAYNSCDSMVTTNIMVNTSSIKNYETLSHFDLYPNPANDDLHLQYTLLKAAVVRFEIKDILSGKVLIESAESYEGAGVHQRKINLGHIPVGTYIICIQAENELLIQKLVKL